MQVLRLAQNLEMLLKYKVVLKKVENATKTAVAGSEKISKNLSKGLSERSWCSIIHRWKKVNVINWY